ncbi:MAG: ABC transporter ATP-binding protein [Phycisphaerales bacterium]
MTAIALQGVGKDYGATTAVRRIDLEIGAGQLFFLLGPSGCGKTTLLRMIAGFIEPTRGTIRFGDRDVTRVPPNRRNAGMVFQSYALWPHMTVFDNVAFGLDVRRVPRDERRARTTAALALVRMDRLAQRRPNELSGGQQQRVALARALVIEPTVLLLDEPLSNLDARLRIEMRTEIRRICKELGITTVYVTHDQKEALSMADAMAVLRDGEIVQSGTPDALYRRPRTRFVADFLGETNFLQGKLVGVDSDGVDVETPAGRLRATASPTSRRVGDAVTLSLRPEALHVSTIEGGNVIRGTRTATTYLGETAQHDIALADGTSIKALEINPRARPRDDSRLHIDPTDVVVLDD